MKKTIAISTWDKGLDKGQFWIMEVESGNEIGDIVSVINPAPEGSAWEKDDGYIKRDLIESFSYPVRMNLAWFYPSGKVVACGCYVVVPPELVPFAKKLEEQYNGEVADLDNVEQTMKTLIDAAASIRQVKDNPLTRDTELVRCKAADIVQEKIEEAGAVMREKGLPVEVSGSVSCYFDVYGDKWLTTAKIKIEGTFVA